MIGVGSAFLDEHRDVVLRMILDAKSAGQIAMKLANPDVTRNAVIGWCRRRGYKLRGRPVTAPRPVSSSGFGRLKEAAEAIRTRMDASTDHARMISALCARYGVSKQVMWRFLREEGIEWMRSPKKPLAREPRPQPLPVVQLDANRTGIPFLDAGPGQCKFPLWPETERTGNVCGEPVARVYDRVYDRKEDRERALSWCPACRAIVSAPTPRMAEAA